MKRIITTIILSTIFFIGHSQPTDSLSYANELYANNEFEKSIEAYQSIINKGYESAGLYFNLGNAYYKTGQIPNAILNYERAVLLAPNDDDIEFNLNLANQYVIDKIEPLPKPFFVKWWNWLTNLNTPDKWGLYSIISFILSLILISVYLLSNRIALKKLSFSFAIITLLISSLLFSFGKSQVANIKKHNQAIVFSPTVTVKASPDESGTDIFVIHEGLKVKVIYEMNDWVEIKLADGNTGWLQTYNIEKI